MGFVSDCLIEVSLEPSVLSVSKLEDISAAESKT